MGWPVVGALPPQIQGARKVGSMPMTPEVPDAVGRIEERAELHR
jgi:hypothetical protein